ncbi:glycosyltransferase family 9 protein [Candidatus Pelagibacter bacterium nBUS_29]|uniref:glycosyltransferase family 9 protein n=1 Tax=Candidatus Pelagibacter bacterium nBUS_29 TaxID=3374190 RepID=UPI003EBAB0A6
MLKSDLSNKKICIVYTHHKLGDLVWQLPYIKAISDHHTQSVDLILREKTQAKNILQDLKYINNINYNNFRKSFYYWIDVWKLIKIFNQNKYSHLYILDKVNKPAIAAKLSGITNIIGPGIGNQKKYLTTNVILNDDDRKLSYSEQSQKLLKLHKINIDNPYPQIEVDIKRFNENNPDLLFDGKKIAFGVDSFEDYKMWYEEDFIKLADLLYEKKLFDYVYLICGPDKSHVAKRIIKTSQKNYFIDCSNKDLTGVITAIKNSSFFVGNNSGPLNLAAALGVKSFGIIVNDAISELKYSKIEFITPKNYKDNTWIRDRKNMKTLSPEEVFNVLIDKIN